MGEKFSGRCNKIVDNKNRHRYTEDVKYVINKITTKNYQISLQALTRLKK